MIRISEGTQLNDARIISLYPRFILSKQEKSSALNTHRLILIIAVLIFRGQQTLAADGKSQDAIIGHWQGISAEDSIGRGMFIDKWRITHDKIYTVFSEKNRDLEYRIDTSKAPNEITLIPDVGPGAGKEFKGIYKIDGDTLTICYVKFGIAEGEKRARPHKFDPKTRNDVILLVFKRHSPAP